MLFRWCNLIKYVFSLDVDIFFFLEDEPVFEGYRKGWKFLSWLDILGEDIVWVFVLKKGNLINYFYLKLVGW
jgi:hypothetical protein